MHERWRGSGVGAVRLIVLDTERVDDPDQTRWLRAKLAEQRPADRWTIVAMHRPAYSAGQHGSDPDVQERWAPLFEEFDVPLVLAGHDHDYQRSHPFDGVVYVVSGAGANVRPTGHAAFTAVSAARPHHLELRVYADRIVGRAIDHGGVTFDVFTIPADP